MSNVSTGPFRPLTVEDKSPMVVYHGNCADGFASFTVAHKYFDGDVVGIPGVYGETLIGDFADRFVFFLDYVAPNDVIRSICEVAEAVIILDHHKSAREQVLEEWGSDEYPSNLYATFDMDRSGALMAWDYFFPNQPAPRMIQHVSDRDLWKFELQGTREYQQNLFSFEYDITTWRLIMDASEDREYYNDFVSGGEALIRKHLKDINEWYEVAKANQFRVDIAGHNVPVLNVPYQYASEAGNIMCKGEPFAATYFDNGGSRIWSLRSDADDPNSVDVSQVAKSLGGGGHKHASGFRSTMPALLT